MRENAHAVFSGRSVVWGGCGEWKNEGSDYESVHLAGPGQTGYSNLMWVPTPSLRFTKSAEQPGVFLAILYRLQVGIMKQSTHVVHASSGVHFPSNRSCPQFPSFK